MSQLDRYIFYFPSSYKSKYLKKYLNVGIKLSVNAKTKMPQKGIYVKNHKLLT